MYQSIMVPTDCSGFDREAIRVGLRLAARTGATLHLVRVRTMNGFVGASCSLEGVEFQVRGERDDALIELTALATECRATADAEVVIAVEDGPVADALAGYSRRNDVELIVISSHGRGGFARFSLGSVTDSLIRHTTVPVLVVKPASSYLNPQVRDSFRRIVVPLDGSSLAERILPSVVAHATLENSEIFLLNVQSLSDPVNKRQPGEPAVWEDANFASTHAYPRFVAERLRREGLT